MSDTYQPILLNKITDEVVIEILNSVVPILEELGIEYFVVGAFARDIGLLAKGYEGIPARITGDIDLAVMLSSEDEFNKLKERLVQTDDFEPHQEEPIKLIYKHKYELDILPFGDIVKEGKVELKAKRTFTLDMPGFAEVFQDAQAIRTNQAFDLHVCSLPGVVILKLLAWDDRNHRIKDIQDIDYILKNFYLLQVEEMATTDTDILDIVDHEKYFTEAVSARYIGRKIGGILQDSEELLSRVRALLITNIQDTDNSAIGKLMSFDTIENAINIINQLYLGIQDTTT